MPGPCRGRPPLEERGTLTSSVVVSSDACPVAGPLLGQQEAAEAFEAFETELSHRAFLTALLAQCYALHLAEGTTGRELGEAALGSLREAEADSTVDILLRGMASLFVCDLGNAAPALHRALAHFEQMSAEEVIEWYDVAWFIANTLWDARASFSAMERVESVARQQGAILALGHALLNSGIEGDVGGEVSGRRCTLCKFLDIRGSSIDAALDLQGIGCMGEATSRLPGPRLANSWEHGTAIGAGWLLQNAHLALATLELGLGNSTRSPRRSRGTAHSQGARLVVLGTSPTGRSVSEVRRQDGRQDERFAAWKGSRALH